MIHVGSDWQTLPGRWLAWATIQPNGVIVTHRVAVLDARDFRSTCNVPWPDRMILDPRFGTAMLGRRSRG